MPNYSIALGVQSPQIDAGRQFQIAGQVQRDRIAAQAAALANRRGQIGLARESGQQNALATYNERNQAGDKNAIDALNQYPQIQAQVLSVHSKLDDTKKKEFEGQLTRNARRAQSVLGAPPDQQQAVWQSSLKEALDAGDITQEAYDRESKSPVNALKLSNVIQMAVPFESQDKVEKTKAETEKLRAQAKYYSGGAPGRGSTSSAKERIAAKMMEMDPSLSYQEAISLASRAPKDDTMRRETLALSAAKEDFKGFSKDPKGTLDKWRKIYGLSDEPGAAPPPATGSTEPAAAQPPPASAPPGTAAPPAAAAPAPQYREGQTATNPQTGEKIIFRGGTWQKL